MTPYWLLFLFSAYLAVSKQRHSSLISSEKSWSFLWQMFFLLIAIFIGLRHQVGGDWLSYLVNTEETKNLTLSEAFAVSRGDPADSLLKWVSSNSGLGVYLINSVYATLFAWGLLTFCRTQPRPWLALTVSVPYLIIVVAMGYSRQGVAIGLVMLGLSALVKKGVFKFMMWVALAALFHKSAIVLVPLALVAGTRNRLMNIFWVILMATLLFSLLLKEHLDNLVSGYITDQYESSGASIRVAMNALPALLFLLLRKRFHLAPDQSSFWTWMAFSALAFLPILYFSPSSTAVDRVALYWIPLQMFVWSRLPDAIGKHGAINAGWSYTVVAYSATVQFVWLFFSVHSVYWLPYKFYPWTLLWQ